ncbi:MAG TPA: carboxyl transferase domain-containing protein [Thermoanaerobaculaceae bacterium]|nr:carboxyl transferase domain-containing protein [Thermoanaerobaculaceae bacterium]
MRRLSVPAGRGAAFDGNLAHWQHVLEALLEEETRLRAGGGENAARRHTSQGKMLVRDRLAALLDPGAPFVELGVWAGWRMYDEWGGAPSAGCVVGVGTVSGRRCVVVANDATVKAGAWFPITCKKILRAQEIALENRLPVVYLVDSAGVFLPLQDEIFPDKEHFGRVFFNNARLSAAGIYQIAAIMGPCVAGGAYLPIMSDEALIVEGTGSIFLAGPALVRAAIGEQIETELLGGAEVMADVAMVVDDRFADDAACLAAVRDRLGHLAAPRTAPFDRIEPAEPATDPAGVMGVIPADRARPYDTYALLAHLLDRSELDEYKATSGRSLVCGTGRIGGWAVGVVANQRAVVARKRGLDPKEREMQIGGVIYADAADKGARFVELCNQKGIPLLFLQDVTGFMVGSRAEREGIIKDGAKMVNVVANSTVPKITVVVGNSYGAGNYAMAGKAYGPRFIFAWPSACIAVMGGEQAAQTLLQLQVGKREVSEDEKQALLEEIRGRYEATEDPRYAAARLWVDGILDPRRTREVVAACIEACAHQGEVPPARWGVLQT